MNTMFAKVMDFLSYYYAPANYLHFEGADIMPLARDMFDIPDGPNWDWRLDSYIAKDWRVIYYQYRTPDDEYWWNSGPLQYHLAISVPDEIVAMQMVLSI
jgi:hypothetical protein